jgi:hypothetical protein
MSCNILFLQIRLESFCKFQLTICLKIFSIRNRKGQAKGENVQKVVYCRSHGVILIFTVNCHLLHYAIRKYLIYIFQFSSSAVISISSKVLCWP